MKNRYFTVIVLCNFFFLLSSCRINGSFQGLYSYYNKSKKTTPDLFLTPTSTNSICTLVNSDNAKVYVINGTQLKNCLEKEKDAIVYIWGPKCKSKICYPLETLQRECDENNIELYIVAEYYDSNLMSFIYNIQNPIFGIDTEYYNSDLTSKYVAEFIHDITSQNNIENKFYYFKDGTFQYSFNSIEDSIDFKNGKTTSKYLY